MQPLVFVKIGGSLISPKEGGKRIEKKRLKRILDEIVKTIRLHPKQRFVISHGHGQIGHARILEHNLRIGESSNKRGLELSKIMTSAIGVNQIVLAELQVLGIPAVPLHLHQALVIGGEREKDSRAADYFFRALDNGLYPVPNGVMMLRKNSDWTVWSTEKVIDYLIVQSLLRDMRVARVVLITNTNGVLDRDGQRMPKIRLADLAKVVTHSVKGDGTGGMEEKLRYVDRWVKNGVEVRIISGNGVGDIGAALVGKKSGGTLFVR